MAAARRPARAPAARRAAAPVEREMPSSRIRKEISLFATDAYYAAQHDLLPGVDSDPWFGKGGITYQSWTNMHADEIDKIVDVKKRVAYNNNALILLCRILREYVDEARRCETDMLKYPDDPVGFLEEGLPDTCPVISLVSQAADSLKAIEGKTLADLYEQKAWIGNYVKGEIMRSPMLPRVTRHAEELTHRFLGFIKRLSHALAAAGLWQGTNAVDLGVIGGALVLMGFSGEWLNGVMESVQEEVEQTRAEMAERRAAAAASPNGTVVVDENGNVAPDDIANAAEPDAADPDAAEPDAAEPDAAEPDAA